MSTIGYESWAVDIAEVTTIYPFQGSEVLMTIIGVVFWIGFHIIQMKRENKEVEEEAARAKPEDIARGIDEY